MAFNADFVSEEKRLFNINAKRQEEIFRSFRASRVLVPILLGIGVGLYMVYRNFDPAEFEKIRWTGRTFFWVGIAAIFLVIRHLFYSLRLYILADGALTFRKCVELLFIWEFSTAITPTSAGGAAVALFVLTLEKIPPAKTAVIVIYKVLLDSIFYLVLFPILFVILGFQFISPETIDIHHFGGLGYTFLTVYGLMALQGGLLFYGVFFNPKGFRNLMDWVTRLPLLNRFNEKAKNFGEEVMIASVGMKGKDRNFHYRAFGTTIAAWICRFMMVNVLIYGIYEDMNQDLHSHAIVFGRVTTMYVVTLFAPSPGGAGFAEAAFVSFLRDYIPTTIASVVGLIWRMMSHYTYLLVGAAIVPNWLTKLLLERRKQKE
ncbi:MAG: lysylphosphatidylglycerol synthase transmembrane domain-containing protein [Saprospiraceae bacterium]